MHAPDSVSTTSAQFCLAGRRNFVTNSFWSASGSSFLKPSSSNLGVGHLANRGFFSIHNLLTLICTAKGRVLFAKYLSTSQRVYPGQVLLGDAQLDQSTHFSEAAEVSAHGSPATGDSAHGSQATGDSAHGSPAATSISMSESAMACLVKRVCHRCYTQGQKLATGPAGHAGV